MLTPLDEHLGYLQIERRLDLYREAMAAHPIEGATVADLGCGIGVLGLLCLEEGAAHIYGIDHSDAIELAREAMVKAGLSERYTCLRESTFRAKLPERVDLLVCDHIGYFGIDYGIVDMLRDAKARFLKPDGAIIPRSITPVVAGISSDVCRDLGNAWGDAGIPETYRWLGLHARNAKHAVDVTADDICTDTLACDAIRMGEAGPDLFSVTGELVALRDCRLDGLAGWFDAELADGVRMTNSPLAKSAIKRSQVFLPCAEAFDVEASDRIGVSVKFRSDGETLAWTIEPPAGTPQFMSTWRSRILTGSDLATAGGRPPVLGTAAKARAALLALVDGMRTSQEIAEIMAAEHGALFPSEAELRRFVARELSWAAR
ncbi:MAG: methyltransferase [Alteraurantiacibacter sp.]